MTSLLVIAAIVVLAFFAPWFGADSRGLTDRAGGPPDVLPDPPERHSRPAAPPVHPPVPGQTSAGSRTEATHREVAAR
jgi:hypothetical protein